MKLTQKQETFCLNLFQGMSQHEAYLKAGYSNKQSPAVIDKNASILAKTSKVLVRIDELRKKAEDDSVMDVLERKQRLTEIARAKLTDFMELGQDGAWVNIGPETKNGGAISEIHSRTEYDDDGAKPTVHTSVKLHNPVEAIKELNKMDKVYTEGGTNVNIDNRSVTIIYELVSPQKGQEDTKPPELGA
jgi:phage terminase small subunit